MGSRADGGRADGVRVGPRTVRPGAQGPYDVYLYDVYLLANFQMYGSPSSSDQWISAFFVLAGIR